MILDLIRLQGKLFLLFSNDVFPTIILFVVGDFNSLTDHESDLTLFLFPFLMDFSEAFFLLLLSNAFLLGEVRLALDLGLYLFAFDHFSGEICELDLETFTHVLLGVCIADDDVVEILASHCALKFGKVPTVS